MATSNATPDTVQIQLTKGYVAIIDAIDAGLANANWHAAVSKESPIVYALSCVPRNGGRAKAKPLHRMVYERIINRPLEATELVDHINGDGLDNRRCNLRLATHKQNMRNRRRHKNNQSGYKGVSWHKKNAKWRAQYTYMGTNKTIGYFDDPKDAYEAYCEAVKNRDGEFARLE